MDEKVLSRNKLDEQSKEIIKNANNTFMEYEENITIVELFQRQVQKQPNAIAVIYNTESLTYQQLDEKSNSVAWRLKEKNVKSNDLVAIIADRTLEMVVAIFGILKAGAAYVPISPNNPVQRTRFILQEGNCKVLFCEKKIFADLKYDIAFLDIFDEENYCYKSGNVQEYPNEKDLAYVIYTSGSTGNPKGVMIEHKSLVNRLLWMQDKYPIDESDTLIQKTPITFDVSVWEMFWWSIAGAKLCVIKPNMEKFPQALIEAIFLNKVTVIHFVPSMMDAFLKFVEGIENLEQLSSLKQVFCSGEKLSVNQVKKFNQILFRYNGTKLTNLYGPTEATIDVTYFECPVDDTFDVIPIGKPIYNTEVLVLNEKGEVQPIGQYGEICILGRGLSRGYINRDDLTKEVFVPYCSDKNRIMYKTGDIGRWLPTGDIEYKERKDFQVKIRGLRIELSEIEKVIEAYQEGLNCIVVTKKISDSITYINGFIEGSTYIDIKELKDYLRKHLPEYMIPNNICLLQQFPLTINGKIDRKALQNLDVRRNKVMEGDDFY